MAMEMPYSDHHAPNVGPWQHHVANSELQWENVTSQLGYNNVRVAKEIYRQLKKKLDGATGALVITPGAGDPKTPSKVGKRTGRVGTKTPGSAKSNKANKSKEAQPEEEQGSSIPGEKQGDDAVAEDPFVV